MTKEYLIHKKQMFEKLPEVKSRLDGLHHTIIWFGDDSLYHTTFIGMKETVSWLNGAFYAFGMRYPSLKEIKKEEEMLKNVNKLDEARGFEVARGAMFRSYKDK